MKLADRYSRLFRYLLPSPFSIAVLLTVLTFVIAFLLKPQSYTRGSYGIEITQYWYEGLWNNGLIVFAFQMMLMLVLGHVLALTPFVSRCIDKIIIRYTSSTAQAAAVVTFLTILVSFLNWGLALIFGAIFARKIAEHCEAKKQAINYALIGAAGYAGLMTWHGGMSGSSLVKVAEKGHLKEMASGILNVNELNNVPELIDFTQTVFSSMNLTVSLILLIVLPSLMYLIGKRAKTEIPVIRIQSTLVDIDKTKKLVGAERLDHGNGLAMVLGIAFLCWCIFLAIDNSNTKNLQFINPNYINFLLLSLGLILHGNITRFINSVDSAIGGAAGILIQFPLYFGIMGIMKNAGIVESLATFFVSISNETTFPILTFFSASIVNIFVPSGGGQWAVQGPVIIKAALDLHVPLNKGIMALAYGDQLTNMLQPFWALPLLGITGLKAKEIIPYTLILMLAGMIIFTSALLLF